MPQDARELTVRLQLSRSVESFHDLLMVAEGLSEIDNFATSWPDFFPFPAKPPDEYLYRRFRRFGAPDARIKKVEISSPPLIVLQCSPEWLGIYLACAGLAWAGVVGVWNMVATYDDFKTGLESIRTDLHKQVEQVAGLRDRARQIVIEVIDSFVDGLLAMAEQEFEAALARVRRIQEARSRLAIPSVPAHTSIEITEDKTDKK